MGRECQDWSTMLAPYPYHSVDIPNADVLHAVWLAPVQVQIHADKLQQAKEAAAQEKIRGLFPSLGASVCQVALQVGMGWVGTTPAVGMVGHVGKGWCGARRVVAAEHPGVAVMTSQNPPCVGVQI